MTRNRRTMTFQTKKTCHLPKNLNRGSLSNLCDADADSCERLCRPPPYGEGGVGIKKTIKLIQHFVNKTGIELTLSEYLLREILDK